MVNQEAYFRTVLRGALAGVIGSIVQAGVGAALDRAVLPPKQHNNIAPRLVKRLAQLTGDQARPGRDWTLGTLFHLGYGVSWGMLLGLARRWSGIPPVALGGAASGLIYLLAFSSRGLGTLTATEPPPRLRSWRKQLSLIAIAGAYALTTTSVEERLTRRGLRCSGAEARR